MRIVYNLRDQNWETTKSLGVLNVSLRVLEGLAGVPGIDRIDVLANRSLAARLPASPEAARVCHFHGLDRPAPRQWSRLSWDHWTLVTETNRLRPDWLLLPKGFAPLVRWPDCRVSAYVHDNIFAYYRSVGQNPFPPGEAALFSRALARTAARADVIVTNSQFTADEFHRTCQPRTQPVKIGAPVHVAPSVASRGSGDALLLLLSSWPHKLATQALTWLQRWVDETKSNRPVHGVGSLPAGVAWPVRPNWHHHVRPDETHLAQLRTKSSALIYFSAYEGYGLPPIEALAEGLPAVASDLPPLREILPPACRFANDSYASFRSTLDAALSSPTPRPLRLDTPFDVAGRWVAELKAFANRQSPAGIRP
jgi:hypothetical protein